MSLVSGRPISFQMDLYQPLYVSRPVVEPELFASLRPPTYSGAMEADKDMARSRAPGFGGGGPPMAPQSKEAEGLNKYSRDGATSPTARPTSRSTRGRA